MQQALHPFDGKTTPNMGTGGYSWLKAPRYMSGTTPTVYEVGPLARMVITYLNRYPVTADDTVVGGTSLGQALGGSSLGYYSVTALVNTALGLVGQATCSSSLQRARKTRCKGFGSQVYG